MAPAASRGGKAGRRQGAASAKELGADATTAELEAIVFGKSLQTTSGADDGEDNAADMPEADDDDTEVLPLVLGDTGSQKPTTSGKAKRAAKRKRGKKAGDELEPVTSGVATAAWADPDDAELEVDLTLRNRTQKLRRSDVEATVSGAEYERRLREQFLKLNGTANWAEQRHGELDADVPSDSEDEVEGPGPPATSAKPIAHSADQRLQPGQIDIKCMQRVQVPVPSSSDRAAVVQSLQFHPDSELMLTAGLDKTVNMFSVDGVENAKVASYFFKQFPIMGATFTPDGNQVLLTGRDSRMWSLDVRTGEPQRICLHTAQRHSVYRRLVAGPRPSDAPALQSNDMFAVLGDAGTVLVCDVPSKQPVRTLRMSVPGVAAVFSADQNVLYSADQDSYLYEWDLATGRCKQRVKAAFATGIETLAWRRATANASTPLLAVGTNSGNIDIFDVAGPKLSPKPSMSIANLTTMVTSLRFHPEGELLLGASKFKKDSLRLVHCATGTVFENWPTIKTALNRVSAVDFSRQGGMLAMANAQGKVLLYQLRHYAK